MILATLLLAASNLVFALPNKHIELRQAPPASEIDNRTNIEYETHTIDMPVDIHLLGLNGTF
jgi:hypothetical protein